MWSLLIVWQFYINFWWARFFWHKSQFWRIWQFSTESNTYFIVKHRSILWKDSLQGLLKLCQMGLQVCGRKRMYGFWKDGVFLGFPGFKWITYGCMGIYLCFLWKTMTGKSVHCLMSVWIYKNRYVFKKANSNPC